jgi:hypothetical protein
VPTRWWIVLWGIALVALSIGACGALIYGFWDGEQDCHTWANRHGYQLEHDDWWAKTGGCVARTPDGIEVVHSESLGSKATGWVWQFAIFAVGTLPAASLVIYVGRNSRG